MLAAGAWNPSKSDKKFVSWNILALLCVGLSVIEGCALAQKYAKPIAQTPPSYKEMGNWKPAEPSDAARKDNWWGAFKDAEVNRLERQLTRCIQSLLWAEARS